MATIVEEIYKMRSDTALIIKELQTVKGEYKELTAEQQKQVIQLGLLEQKEKQLTAARNKSTNPTAIIKINKALDDNLKKLGALKEATDKFTKSESLAKQEANALSTAVNNAFKTTQFKAAQSDLDAIKNKAGAAASGFNPLHNSVSQITREFPAFAVSANVGFLAISNNLPIFFDALEKVNKQNAILAKDGIKPVSVVKQLFGAFLSLTNVLSLAVTALTVFGPKLFEMITAFFEGEKALESMIESNKKYVESLNDIQKSINRLTVDFKVYSGEITKLQGQLLLIEQDRINAGNKEKANRAERIEALKKELGVTKEMVAEFGKTKTFVTQGGEVNTVFTQSGGDRKAVQRYFAGLAEINKDYNQQIGKLQEEANLKARIERLKAEEDAKSTRIRFSREELIRQKNAYDEIRQLQIDSMQDEQRREEEQANFNFEKKLRDLDLANELQAQKLAILKNNYEGERNAAIQSAKSDEQSQRQLNADLIKLKEDYLRDVKKLEADNIPLDQQNKLRLGFEDEYQRARVAITDKYNKIIYEKATADFELTQKSRLDILNENNDFELFLLQDRLDREKEKGKKASKDELQRIRALILAKKIEILNAQADQDKQEAIARARKDGRKENAVEILAIENKLQNDIARLRLQSEKDERQSLKDRTKQYIDYFSQIITAAINATQQILALKIKEVDGQISNQEKRVQAAKDIAERGNADLLELEQKRLDDLTKKKEKFVRDQQALAAVELVANTAIAVSKAAAEGGAAAGVTIAAALIALVAGLASARSIASQAAFYEGGYTGDGNPTDVSTTMNGRKASRPYIWHKEEFVMNHKKTRQFGDIFQDVHDGKVDLREWKGKAMAYDILTNYRPMNLQAPMNSSPVVNNIIRFHELESQMFEMNNNLKGLKLVLNADEHGFSTFMERITKRKKFISDIAKP